MKQNNLEDKDRHYAGSLEIMEIVGWPTGRKGLQWAFPMHTVAHGSAHGMP